MTVSGGSTASRRASDSCLTGSRSGAFSCTKSARATDRTCTKIEQMMLLHDAPPSPRLPPCSARSRIDERGLVLLRSTDPCCPAELSKAGPIRSLIGLA